MNLEERKKQLSSRLVEYAKEYNYYEFNDCYENDEEAYNNFFDLLGESKKIQNVLNEIAEDFEKTTDNENDESIEILYLLHKDLFNYKRDLRKMEKECEVER